MQFMPDTWKAYGVDGDGDGRADITDLDDSVYSAAHYLTTNFNEKGSIELALWQYNHSWDYVHKVLKIAG